MIDRLNDLIEHGDLEVAMDLCEEQGWSLPVGVPMSRLKLADRAASWSESTLWSELYDAKTAGDGQWIESWTESWTGDDPWSWISDFFSKSTVG